MAMSYEAVKDVPFVDNMGNVVEGKFNLSAYLNDLMNRLSGDLSVQWVGMSSVKFLSVGLLICLLVAGYFATSKKKYINGKEYGTSEWATPKQIAHLLAKNILKTEIKNIKKDKKNKGKENKDKKKEKIKDVKEKYSESSNEIFTQTEKICIYNYELNRNVLIVGGSGSGKTRGYVLPNILQCANSKYSQSLVVTDPKGEILAKVGKYLESIGYEIRVLNLKEQNRSFCYNPFNYIMEEKYEEQISSLVSAVMDSQMQDNSQKSQDPFWDEMAKVLLKSIFYANYMGFPKREQNMGTVMEMFRWFEVSDEDDRESNPTKLDKFFEVFGDCYGNLSIAKDIRSFLELCFGANKELQTWVNNLKSKMPLDIKEMRKHIEIPLNTERTMGIEKYVNEIENISIEINDSEDDELKSLILPNARELLDKIDKYINDRVNNYPNGDKPMGVKLFEKYGDVNRNPALRSWEDFRTKCKGKTAQSVTATALAKLAPFDEEQIRRIFSKDEMELDLVGERKTALFIVLPPTNKTYNFVANVMYRQLFEQLEYCATVKHNQMLPVPVKFICDEFYNTGKLPNFENILSYARSFGIGITIILQSLEQLKEMYEKSWGTILDNCSCFLYLGGVKNKETLQYISDLIGKGTFDKKTYSVTKGTQSSSSTSHDKIGRELLDSAEVQRLNKKKCLLFITGYQPYMSMKFNYKTHRNYKFTSDYDKKNLYNYLMPSEKEVIEQQSRPIETKVDEPIGVDTKTETKVENKSSKVDRSKYETEQLVLNTDEQELSQYVQDNMLKLGITEVIDYENMEDDELQSLLNEELAKEEEVKAVINKYNVEPIALNTNEEELTKYVVENQEKLDIVETDYYNDIENDELQSLLDEELAKEEEAKVIINEYNVNFNGELVKEEVKPQVNKYQIDPVVLTTEREAVAEIIEEFSDKKENIEFVTEYEIDDNIEVTEADIEEWEDDSDTVKDMDIVSALMGELDEDMESFLEQLSNVTVEEDNLGEDEE